MSMPWSSERQRLIDDLYNRKGDYADWGFYTITYEEYLMGAHPTAYRDNYDPNFETYLVSGWLPDGTWGTYDTRMYPGWHDLGSTVNSSSKRAPGAKGDAGISITPFGEMTLEEYARRLGEQWASSGGRQWEVGDAIDGYQLDPWGNYPSHLSQPNDTGTPDPNSGAPGGSPNTGGPGSGGSPRSDPGTGRTPGTDPNGDTRERTTNWQQFTRTGGPGLFGGVTYPEPYTPERLTFDPSMSVEARLSKILESNSPLMQRAKTTALQGMNARGLLNSSLALGAVQAAMVDAAFPVAMQDAQGRAGDRAGQPACREFGVAGGVPGGHEPCPATGKGQHRPATPVCGRRDADAPVGATGRDRLGFGRASAGLAIHRAGA